MLILLFAFLVGCEDFKGCPPMKKTTYMTKIHSSKFIGQWINTSYLEVLQARRSTYRAQLATHGISTINIEPQYLETSELTLVNNMHDGTQAKVQFIKKNSKLLTFRNTATKHDAVLSLVVVEKDTVLLVSDIESKQEIKFKKMPLYFEGLSEFLNRRLFTGNYLVVKDAEKNALEKNITFLSNGDIIGHKYFTKYEIWYDFYDDVPQMDTVVFRDRRGKQYWFGWTRNHTSLMLYNLDGEDENTANAEAKLSELYMFLKPIDN